LTVREGIEFFAPARIPLSELLELSGAVLGREPSGDWQAGGVSALSQAGPADVTFLDNPLYRRELAATRAGACFVRESDMAEVPHGTLPLVTAQPYLAFALLATRLYPQAAYPAPVFGENGIAPGATIHASARIEAGVSIDPGAVIGPGAEIGTGSTIGANSVIGPYVRIGRNSHIASNVTITHALIGNDVIIHSGASIGQDGFGFAIGRAEHRKVPQIGRVIIQDRVEIGATSCVDRGGTRDTVIGEGTKIDNMVHIAHNVEIGRHCLIAAQVGIAGSSVVEDFVILGGKVGITGHVTIGAGSQIAANSGIISSVAPGSKLGGMPAKPLKEWFREVAVVARLARMSRGGRSKGQNPQADGVDGGEGDGNEF
jgi:UDP-3-O-[3-hydroxymyristoyl] glucosamine N-acyltransferase